MGTLPQVIVTRPIGKLHNDINELLTKMNVKHADVHTHKNRSTNTSQNNDRIADVLLNHIHFCSPNKRRKVANYVINQKHINTVPTAHALANIHTSTLCKQYALNNDRIKAACS